MYHIKSLTEMPLIKLKFTSVHHESVHKTLYPIFHVFSLLFEEYIFLRLHGYHQYQTVLQNG